MHDWEPIVLLTANILAAVAMWRGFRGRATGGVPRCRRCWYDLSGGLTPPGGPLTCPECGREDTLRRGLWKRRRSWTSVVVFALAQWLVCYTWLLGTPGRTGLAGAVPTSLLVFVVDDLEAASPLPSSLRARWQAGEIWAWQERVLAGRMLDHWLEGRDASEFLSYRPRAVIGEPLAVLVATSHFGPLGASPVFVMSPDDDPARAVRWLANMRGLLVNIDAEHWREFEPVQAGESTRDITLTLVAPIVHGSEPLRRDVTFSLPVEPVASADLVLERVSDPATVDAIRGLVELRIRVRLANGSHQLRLRGLGYPPRHVVPDSCSLAFTYTIEHHGAVIESGRVGDAMWLMSGRLADLTAPHWAPHYDRETRTFDPTGLVLRMRPDISHAMADLSRHSIWEGEIVINLEDASIERFVSPGAVRDRR